MNVEGEISLLIADDAIEDNSIKNIRVRLQKIKDALNDIYNIVDIWYQSGSEFPFEIDININGKNKTIRFDSIKQMVSTIRLLE